MDNITEGPLWEALKEAWDGRTEYVIVGGTTYRALTPNGEEHPIFAPTDDASFYGSTSTGMVKSQPASVDKAKIGPAKRARPGVTSNPSLTDIYGGGE